MRVATHDGSFHADEVFALAALTLLHADAPLEIVRTRDAETLAGADLRVDVGFRDDPATGDFDHHQRDFAGVRENGVRLASFGLVWRAFGTALCGGDAALAQALDMTLVQTLDAADTGQSLSEPTVPDVHPVGLAGVIGAYNAHWDETLDAAAEEARFAAAVALAGGILEREIASVAAARRATDLVLTAVAEAADPRLIELPVGAPWKWTLVPAAPEALYVIAPRRRGWGVEGVPVARGTFELRRPLPAAWAGLGGEDLQSATGIADARFCHVKRFLTVADSREGALALAALALQAPPE